MSSSQHNNDDPQEPSDGSHAVRVGKSAQLNLHASAASPASMREAMNPANESLGEALRLSYRLLQVAMCGLVVTFIFSGFQSVPEGVTGIRTIFGRVSGDPGDEMIVPGLQPFWPYPVGETVTMPLRRTVEVRDAFWPTLGAKDTTIEQATDSADPNNPIRPGRDGSVITADGDLAHLQLGVEYSVVDPVAALGKVNPEHMDMLVDKVLQGAVVQVAAEFTLSELLEQRDLPAAEIRARMQTRLDALQSGIHVGTVTITERTAPLAVRNALHRVQVAREDMKTALERARQEANAKLVGAAGPQYAQVLALIAEYESHLTAGRQAQADALLQKIGERLEQPDIGGEAARIILHAKSYEALLVSTLTKEVQRIEGLAASFHENPRQLIQQLWLDAVREAMSKQEVEVFALPPGIGHYAIHVKSSPDVMQTRRDAELERKKQAAAMMNLGAQSFQLGSKQIMIDRPGRRLEKTGDKGFGR